MSEDRKTGKIFTPVMKQAVLTRYELTQILALLAAAEDQLDEGVEYVEDLIVREATEDDPTTVYDIERCDPTEALEMLDNVSDFTRGFVRRSRRAVVEMIARLDELGQAELDAQK